MSGFLDAKQPGGVAVMHHHNAHSASAIWEEPVVVGFDDRDGDGFEVVTAFSSGLASHRDGAAESTRTPAAGSTGQNESTERFGLGAGGDAGVAFEKFDDMSYTRVGIILLSLGLCSFLYAIEQTIVATAVSEIAAGVHATGSLTWITTSYLLTTTVIQPITGRLSDVFGTKNLLIAEIWIFVLGNIIAGTAHQLPQLVAGRLVSGVGGAGLLSLSIIIVSQLTNEKQRGSYLNLINVVFIVADSLGPILGGALARSGHWRWIFLLNAPIGPVVSLVLILVVHIKTPSRSLNLRYAAKNLDTLGMFMLITNLTLLIVALNLGGEAYPWNSPVIIGLLVGAGVALLAFVYAESLATYPILPLALFVRLKWRNVPLMTVVRCLLFFHIFSATFYVPLLLQVTGKSSTVAAVLVIPFLFMAALSSISNSYVSLKTGLVRTTLAVSQAILAVGMGLMSTLDEKSSVAQIVGYSLIFGLGFGAGTQLTLVIAQAGLPNAVLPTVTAWISSTPNLGGVLGVGIIGTIINNAFRERLASLPSPIHISINEVVAAARDPVIGEQVVDSYVGASRLGFRILAGIAVLQFVLCLGLREVVLDDGKKRDRARGVEDATMEMQDVVGGQREVEGRGGVGGVEGAGDGDAKVQDHTTGVNVPAER
ncbi:major facilitator superfamily domain-containing protein [Cristinia sonorae]|uniref:Major facilitator superfamily domain-containing protein n=1 Tax=Cristinia sonorae TaxID=1940300 RepID=A0A8K0UI31_9AGAR|nr:major facilitator superfamily domain-containing protein [Cristinia sonorae]